MPQSVIEKIVQKMETVLGMFQMSTIEKWIRVWRIEKWRFCIENLLSQDFQLWKSKWDTDFFKLKNNILMLLQSFDKNLSLDLILQLLSIQNIQMYKMDVTKDLNSQVLESVYDQSKTTLSDA